MNFNNPKTYKSHGDGSFSFKDFRKIGDGVVFEKGAMVFHPENISLGSNIYVGHNAILKGYYKNEMVIEDYSWIGPGCFLFASGGIRIGKAVGVGHYVKIISSQHADKGDLDLPVIFNGLEFGEVVLKDGCDIGTGSVILPGVTVGQGAIVGAGAVVTKNIPDFEVWAGVPAVFKRKR